MSGLELCRRFYHDVVRPVVDVPQALKAAYRAVGELHNQREITSPVELGVERMWGRPFEVVWGDFPGALSAAIQDPEVRRIADRWPVGGIEQIRSVLWKAPDRHQLVDSR